MVQEPEYHLSNQSCVEDGKLLVSVCALDVPYNEEVEIDQRLTIYYISGAKHLGGAGPYSHLLATEAIETYVISSFPEETRAFSIRFEGVYTDKEGRHLLLEASFLDGDGDEIDMYGDIQVNDLFAKFVETLEQYTASIIDIDEDGEYLLTSEAVGFEKGDGCFFSEHADVYACSEIQDEYGCWEFRGWISED